MYCVKFQDGEWVVLCNTDKSEWLGMVYGTYSNKEDATQHANDLNDDRQCNREFLSGALI